jgi:Protein of unknown function (DUF2855)
MQPLTCLDFEVDRENLSQFRWTETAVDPVAANLPSGGALLAVQRFAFTANNITYALCGDAFGYWRYFPAPSPWGRVPVWGVAQVLHTRTPMLSEGESVYGFFPMSTHVSVLPREGTDAAFMDGTSHRASLPRTYNEYARIDRAPAFDPATADLYLVLRPLFSLSFFMAAYLTENRFFGAKRVLISSASSKTALGLAFLLGREQSAGVEVIGLTGATNAPKLAGLGRYDQVLSYPQIGELSSDVPSVFVDIAGDPAITGSVHHHLALALTHSSAVGFTRGRPQSDAPSLPGPPPEFFFTPSHILARRKSWGAGELRRRLAEAWTAFLVEMAPRLRIETGTGRSALEETYQKILQGRSPPDLAHIVSFAQS